jgi:hypothetical protein
MTVDTARTVQALLDEEPLMRVYSYVHARTGHRLYACFVPGQYDDMYCAPEVTEACLLFTNGVATEAGAIWQETTALDAAL